ncbi:MAG: HEAT repeat domain-containing protein [Candidatus Hodarchaeota archaeon]
MSQVIPVFCVILALYGLVFELMYWFYGTGSQWGGFLLLTPAILYFGSFFLQRTVESIQKNLHDREKRRKNLKVLNKIEELISSPLDPIFRIILYLSTQIDDLRFAFSWLAKTITLFSTKEVDNLKIALNELSDDSYSHYELFNLLERKINHSSLESWPEILNKESKVEPSAVVRQLSEIKSLLVASLLLQNLNSPDSKVRREAISGLRNYYSDEIVSELLDAARNESDKKVESYIRYFFYLNRSSIRDSDKRIEVFNLVMERWWDQSHLHEHTRDIIVTLLPSLTVEARVNYFPVMLDLLSSTESKALDRAILEVLESDFASLKHAVPVNWIRRHHLAKIRELFHRNSNRMAAFKHFQQIIGHGALIGFAQIKNDPT